MTYMSSEELTARLVECGYCICPSSEHLAQLAA